MKEKTLFFKLLGYILKQKLHFLLDLSLRKEMGLRNDDAVCLSVCACVAPNFKFQINRSVFTKLRFSVTTLQTTPKPNFYFPKTLCNIAGR
jgi:hypothetical protein